MFIVTFDSAVVNSTPSAVFSVEARPFGLGNLRRPSGPTLTDLAYESGRTIGLEAEREVDPPALYSAVERAAFLDGMAEAFALLAAREADYLDELAENHANVEAVCRGFVPL
jgi:hypothetical protein